MCVSIWKYPGLKGCCSKVQNEWKADWNCLLEIFKALRRVHGNSSGKTANYELVDNAPWFADTSLTVKFHDIFP